MEAHRVPTEDTRAFNLKVVQAITRYWLAQGYKGLECRVVEDPVAGWIIVSNIGAAGYPPKG